MVTKLNQPTSGYGFSLCAGAVGLPFLGIGLGGALIGRAGGDPVRAFDVDGMVMFLLAFAIGFAVRLIFWPPAPPALRSAVRTIVTAIFAVGIPAAIVGLMLSLRLPTSLHHRAVPNISQPWLSSASQAPYCGSHVIARKASEPLLAQFPSATRFNLAKRQCASPKSAKVFCFFFSKKKSFLPNPQSHPRRQNNTNGTIMLSAMSDSPYG